MAVAAQIVLMDGRPGRSIAELICARLPRMSLNRRTFLTSVAAAGAGALIPGIRSSAPAFAQAAGSSRLFRIDTHTHFSIPKLYDLAAARGVQQATLKDWTPGKMLQQMEEGG